MADMIENLILKQPPISKHAVWSMLSSRQSISPLSEFMEPDAFIQVTMLAKELSEQFSTIEQVFFKELTEIDFEQNQETVLSEISKSDNKEILQMIIRGDDYAPTLWKRIEPERDDEN